MCCRHGLSYSGGKNTVSWYMELAQGRKGNLTGIEYEKGLMLESYFESLGPAGGEVKLWGRLVICVYRELVTRWVLGVLSHGVCAGSPAGSCSNIYLKKH